MPQYKKVFDVGTYAGVSGYTRVGIPTLRTPGSGGKQVAKSLRFRSANSAYLNRTPASAGDRQKWTLSAWFKRGALGTSMYWFTAGASGSDNDYLSITFDTGNALNVGLWNFTPLSTTQVFKDPNAWYHILLAVDTTQASATNRMVLYINGLSVTSFSTDARASITQNMNLAVNTTSAHNIGRNAFGSNFYYDGYLSEFYIIDGQQLTASSFGEYNSDNIWVPKAYSGSFAGTNSFYLDFSDVGTTTAGGANTGYGKDLSGKGTPNNWTTNNFGTTSTATTYDSMYDSPTDYDNSVYGAGNYAVLNPLDKGSCTISEGNLKFTGNATLNDLVRASILPPSGKWYWEANADNACLIGVAPASDPVTNYPGQSSGSRGYYGSTGGWYQSTSVTGTFATYTSTDVLGFALDVDAGTCAVYKNNALQGTWTGLTNVFPSIGRATGIASFNFGQRPFANTTTWTSLQSSGFKALNTKNITRPTDANMWFYGDTPDLMWIKNRSATSDHSLTDTVRGVGLGLSSSSTAAEQGAQDVAEMNKFGMTLIGASSRTTAASNNFVYWAWKGGGAAVTNTQGSITSQVSANISSGFSVVTYTGDGSASKTVGHGLNAIPSMVIMRKRNVTSDWYVAHYSLNNSYNFAWHMFLNTTGAVSSNNDPYFLSSGNTSSVIEVLNYSGSNGGNQSGTNYVAYCWTPIAGFSSFGSYAGNGSTDGPFIYTGFKVKWLMIKRTDSATNNGWFIIDAARPSYNPVTTERIFGNDPAVYSQSNVCDLLSNGFKNRDNGIDQNAASPGNYIYAAFAEHPFKIARAR